MIGNEGIILPYLQTAQSSIADSKDLQNNLKLLSKYRKFSGFKVNT